MSMESSSRTIFLKAVAACAVVAVSMGLITVGEYAVSSDDGSSDTTGALASLELTPGTYTASAAGIQSDVSVTCTFDENGITSVSVDVSGETDGIGADIGDEMTEQFMSAQGSDVDGVSGATITSDALKAAMDDCIAQASGGSTENTFEAAGEAAEEDEAETEFASEEETETEYAAETESGLTDEAESEFSDESESEISAGDAMSAASYVPGTYTASAEGMESEIRVSVLFNEEKMLSISYDLSGETEDVGAVIGAEMSQNILQAQSSDVDGVSGATVTSDAFREAVSSCIEQAKSGDSASNAKNSEEENAKGNNDRSSTSLYVPGTYTASAAGMESEISISVLFNEEKMLSISYDLSGETEDIGAVIGAEMSQNILQAQSSDVDGVSGATVTSDAFREAVNTCIEKAKSGN